jgi:hypothetical protein
MVEFPLQRTGTLLVRMKDGGEVDPAVEQECRIEKTL